MFNILEKKIKQTIHQIKKGTTTPVDSGIGRLLNKMKDIDMPCHDNLLEEYKTALKGLKK